jgi:hypothetical protein
VPLVEALDEERGVGFDTLDGKGLDESSLLDGLTFPPAAANTVPWGRRETFLLGKLSEALAQGAGKIALSEHDLEALADPESQPASPQAWGPDPLPLPDAFAVLASVAAADEAALARGEFQVLLDAATGPSGARLLGRFCHADHELQRHVERYLRAEEALRPDALFAEVVHLPEGRMGNVLARPVLRAFEIPYLGQAGVPGLHRLRAAGTVGGHTLPLRAAAGHGRPPGLGHVPGLSVESAGGCRSAPDAELYGRRLPVPPGSVPRTRDVPRRPVPVRGAGVLLASRLPL